MIYLDPKNDLIFKRIFGENPDILISFLNALMPFEKDRIIEQIEYLPAELVPETPMSKNSIVDVRCKDNNGCQFIVEMQMYWTPSFMSRVLFNASKAYVRQTEPTFQYKNLQPVYTLSLINDIFREDTEEFYHHYKIVDILNTNKRIKGLEFIFVELPKFKPHTYTEKKMIVLWLRFLTEIKDQTEFISPDFNSSEEIKKAVEILEITSYSKRELAAYDKYWDNISTEMSVMSEQKEIAKQEGLEEGLKEGIEKGRAVGLKEGIEKGKAVGLKEGIEKGLKEGVEKGLKEGVEKGLKEGVDKRTKEIIRNALSMGLSKLEIAKLTQLSEKEINMIDSMKD